MEKGEIRSGKRGKSREEDRKTKLGKLKWIGEKIKLTPDTYSTLLLVAVSFKEAWTPTPSNYCTLLCRVTIPYSTVVGSGALNF